MNGSAYEDERFMNDAVGGGVFERRTFLRYRRLSYSASCVLTTPGS
jgi:hypothetical protein